MYGKGSKSSRSAKGYPKKGVRTVRGGPPKRAKPKKDKKK